VFALGDPQGLTADCRGVCVRFGWLSSRSSSGCRRRSGGRLRFGLILGWIGAAAFRPLSGGHPACRYKRDALHRGRDRLRATRRPNARPQVFGYHELFQVLTVAAPACEYGAVVFYVLPRA
jgi:hypothetical protein